MVGSSGEHLKLELRQDGDPVKALPAIAFGQADCFEYIRKGESVDICYSIELNEFRGTRNLQLNIRDIKTVAENK